MIRDDGAFCIITIQESEVRERLLRRLCADPSYDGGRLCYGRGVQWLQMRSGEGEADAT